MTVAERFASSAESLVGTTFRLHGRTPETGLDCVGLVASSLALAGRQVVAPSGYSLRNLDIEAYLAFAQRNGLVAAIGPIRRGDLVMTEPGQAQHHLLVATSPASFVHAHASLRCVVHQQGALADAPTWHWRISQLLED